MRRSLSTASLVYYVVGLLWAPRPTVTAFSLSSSSSSSFSSLAQSPATTTTASTSNVPTTTTSPLFIVHWKGEKKIHQSLEAFRQTEFRGALEAVSGRTFDKLHFVNALYHTDTKKQYRKNVEFEKKYNGALQYLCFDNTTTDTTITVEELQAAGKRAALVHGIYQVCVSVPVPNNDDNNTNSDNNNNQTKSNRYDRLCLAAQNCHPTVFQALTTNRRASWCLRVRTYYENQQHTFGPKASRSLTHERLALEGLAPLLETFKGAVQLQAPDWKLYVLDGLLEYQQQQQHPGTQQQQPPPPQDTPDSRPKLRQVLARELVRGPRLSHLDPNTRHCVTNTPLDPVLAYSLCNIARLSDKNGRILDPYAGSATILLAASSISANVEGVGIELCHKVNRTDILSDFEHRHLLPPKRLLRGDCLDGTVRNLARGALSTNNNNQQSFDCIVTDPPYGIRESQQSAQSPIVDLLKAIETDRTDNQRLLRVGGRLVLFVPDPKELPHTRTDVHTLLPDPSTVMRAGLELEFYAEQPLNDFLSRWLVSFVCVK